MHKPRPGSAPVVASGGLSTTRFAAMATHAAALHPNVTAPQFPYDRATFGAILQQWQAAGGARFLEHFRLDFPFPAAYGIFGYPLGSRAHMAAAAGLVATTKWLLIASCVATIPAHLRARRA